MTLPDRCFDPGAPIQHTGKLGGGEAIFQAGRRSKANPKVSYQKASASIPYFLRTRQQWIVFGFCPLWVHCHNEEYYGQFETSHCETPSEIYDARRPRLWFNQLQFEDNLPLIKTVADVSHGQQD
jgi:hypothetical protein